MQHRAGSDHTLAGERRRSAPRRVWKLVIDLHCHVLPGIDDGPETIEESMALARAAAANCVGMIVATPHVSWRYPNDAATIAAGVEELNARLSAEGVELEVFPGAEIALTHLPELGREQLSRLALAGGRWLLVEPPFTPIASGLDSLVLDLRQRGHGVVLAHPERCPAFHRDTQMLESLVDAGVLTSITAGSLVGRFGGGVRRFALKLLHSGLVHNVASDAHDHAHRPPGMAAELEQAGLGPLADWLTRAVPAAILTDREIPPRPAVALPEIETKRSFWRPGRRD
jgi:protein-tyrosine phosphatase